ncbi:hypothetical protein LLG95_14760 [bacterium]|nr:hypothetical protein [bacterium]
MNAGAADNSLFNYQGRVLVQGFPYTGTGQMKVAIIATTGTSTVVSLWSNDGSSVAGSEPSSSFPVTVTGGVFDTMIGDTNNGLAIPAITFNRDDELKIRVWFNDGTHGFQQLTPDRRLTNPRRLGITEVTTSTTLYVNGSTGNDLNSGLTPTSAKKSIQAAVNMVPSKISANMTIQVAAGIYREQVNIYGVAAGLSDQFSMIGDPTTVPSDTVTPNVRITGTNNDSTHLKVRDHGINVMSCHNLAISGFLFDYCNLYGFNSHSSVVRTYRCKSTNNSRGFHGSGHGAEFRNSWASANGSGFTTDAGDIGIVDSGASDNTGFGVAITNGGVSFYGTNSFKRNPTGVLIHMNSMLYINGTTSLTSNTYGIQVLKNSMANNVAGLTYSGNGTNIVVTDSFTY